MFRENFVKDVENSRYPKEDNNKKSANEILYITPIFKQMIWGGNRLANEWKYDIPYENAGECWAVSAHPNGDCVVKEGSYAGKSLSQLWKEKPEIFGNTVSDKFPLLIKIIDANADLSIQVHPDDEYAKNNENGSFGKTECWYILDAPADAALIIGHNARDKKELEEMIHDGKWDQLLREVPVKKGDFIQIDPGTVHAIKGGIEILETQQNSDITYRVYDYDRLEEGKPRELHIDKSMDVITVPAKPVEGYIIHTAQNETNKMQLLISCKYYRVWKLDIDKSISFTQKYPFLIMSITEGKGILNGRPVKKGDHFILPNNFGNVNIQGNIEIIASTIGE